MKIETEDKKLKEEQDLLISWRRVNQIISCVSVILVIAVLPLVYHNYYYDILTVKYIFYYGNDYSHGDSYVNYCHYIFI